MEDSISRQKTIEEVDKYFDGLPIQGHYDMVQIIKNMPSAESMRGIWIYTEIREYPLGYNIVKCSHCNWSHHSRPGEKYILTAEEVARDFNYCPICGARMKRSEE